MFNNIDFRSVTVNIIIICFIVFLLSMGFPQLNQILSLHYFFNNHNYIADMLSGAVDPNLYPNLSSYISSDPYAYQLEGKFYPIQIVSHMFMHGGWAHIIFNMLGLFMFGSVLERVWGAKRFLTFYFVTGFGAVLLHMSVQAFLVYKYTGSVNPTLAMLNNHPEAWGTYFSSTVGASGAIFGVLIAFAMLFPNTELIFLFFPVPVKAKYLVALYVIAELYQGLAMRQGDDVAHFAHLGGALVGFILVKYWNRHSNHFY